VRDPSLTQTWFCALLKTSLFCRVYETLPLCLRDSLGCKDCCANINVLSYLLTTFFNFNCNTFQNCSILGWISQIRIFGNVKQSKYKVLSTKVLRPCLSPQVNNALSSSTHTCSAHFAILRLQSVTTFCAEHKRHKNNLQCSRNLPACYISGN